MSVLYRAKKMYNKEGLDAVIIGTINHLVFYTHLAGQIRARLIGSRSPRIFVNFTRLTSRYLHWRYPYRYSDADPFKIIWVDPNLITTFTTETPKRRGTVRKGEWDLKAQPIHNNTVFKSLKEHFENSTPWQETSLKSLFEDLTEKGWGWGYHSAESFELRCEEIETLYESLDTHGLQTQAEIIQSNKHNINYTDFGIHHPLLNEIGVNIGRDGRIIWRVNGQHRLAISKLLNLDKIPVQIVTRHKQWQDYREQLRQGKTEVPDYVMKHPDMIDLTDL